MNTEDIEVQHSETTGVVLKRKLGLENFRYVRIARVIGIPRRIFYVYYNSYRPDKFVTKMDCTRVPRSAAIFTGDIIDDNEKRPLEYYSTTPPVYIENYNGFFNLSTYIILIDLAGAKYVRDEYFSRKIKESVTIDEKVRVFELEKLDEGITLYDLTKNAGLSKFTSYYSKERGSIMGNENKVSKLIDCKIDEKEGWVDFYFLSEATEKYGSKYQYKEVDPSTLNLVANPSKTYTTTIRILNFFEWLDTYDVQYSITAKDIKDILEVSDVQVFSTSPAMQYQGGNFYLSELGASVYPTDIAPTVWNSYKNKHDGSTHSGNQLLSKDLQRIINQIPFFANPMASMLSKALKDNDLL